MVNWVVSCSAVVPIGRLVAASAVALSLPVGIGTLGSVAMVSFLSWLKVMVLAAVGRRHGRSRYRELVYFCLLYLSLKHLLRLVHRVRPHSPRVPSSCSAFWFSSMMRMACGVVVLNAASFPWKALLCMFLTLWISLSVGTSFSDLFSHTLLSVIASPCNDLSIFL